MYSYTISGEIDIHTPGDFSNDDIKKTFEQYPDYIVNHSVYPNGFEITMTQYADRIEVQTNRPLTQNADGSFTAPTDE